MYIYKQTQNIGKYNVLLYISTISWKCYCIAEENKMTRKEEKC